jgi:hypothetical protein
VRNGGSARILVLAVVLTGFLASCGPQAVSETTAAGSRPPSYPVVSGTRASGPVPIGPLIALTANGENQTARLSNEFLQYLFGLRGSCCWTSPSGAGAVTQCVDVAPPPGIPTSFLPVSGGSVFRLAGNAHRLTARAWLLSPDGSTQTRPVTSGIHVSRDAMVLDLRPGRYRLEVDGQWSQGRVPFFFGIRVR